MKFHRGIFLLLSYIIFNMLFSSLDMSCRSRIAVLNEKLTTLERRIEYLEACVSDSSYIFTFKLKIASNLFYY